MHTGRMNRTLISVISVIILVALTTSGCVGLAAVSIETFSVEKVTLSESRCRIVGWTDTPPTIVKSDVLAKWGKPDRVDTAGEKETWYYHHKDLAWVGGIAVWIPMFVPAGHKALLLEFDNDTLSTISARISIGRAVICGLKYTPGICEVSSVSSVRAASEGIIKRDFYDQAGRTMRGSEGEKDSSMIQ